MLSTGSTPTHSTNSLDTDRRPGLSAVKLVRHELRSSEALIRSHHRARSVQPLRRILPTLTPPLLPGSRTAPLDRILAQFLCCGPEWNGGSPSQLIANLREFAPGTHDLPLSDLQRIALRCHRNRLCHTLLLLPAPSRWRTNVAGKHGSGPLWETGIGTVEIDRSIQRMVRIGRVKYGLERVS